MKREAMNVMNNTIDFKEIIQTQRSKQGASNWEGTVLDYLYLVKDNPDIAQFAPGRIYNMIIKHGVEEVPDELKTRSYDDLVRYKFFDGKIFGALEPIHDLMRFLKAAARRTETGKRILILVGPVSSGKSTIAALIKRGLETDDTPIYAIKGCPINEDPLHLIPMADRPYWEEQLGVKIEGNLCPMCQFMVDNEYTENGVVKWEDVKVVRTFFSEQRRSGIGTFAPSDAKSQDITELIGRINMSKMTRYGETDPRAYEFNGELQIANRGMIEYIEILKADIKFHYILIPAAQEQLIKAPGFPQMYIDTLIVGHTNFWEFDTFKNEKKNEALHDRIYPIYVPWNLRVDDEIKIYEKLIKESDFRDIHIAPNTLKLAAQFAVLSRLTPSTKVSSLIEKMKIYNGEMTESRRKNEVDVRALREEGKAKGEGLTGISPRFIINALNVALGMKEDKKCVTPVDIIRSLHKTFDHQMGIDEKDKEKYLNLLLGEKESIAAEFKEIVRKEVNMAFISAYDEQAQSLFDNYILNASAYCKKEKVQDPITGEINDPDEKLMRQLEELVGVPSNSKMEFRQGLFVHKATLLERGQPFTFKDYPPLKEAIEKYLIKSLKDLVNLTLANKVITDEKMKKRRADVFDRLIEKGYCEHCAEVILSFMSEVLRKES